MVRRLLALALFSALLVPAARAATLTPAQRERVEAAHLLVLGRAATPAELTAASATADASLRDRIAELRARLQAEPSLAAAAADAAWFDARGSAPGPEARPASPQAYADLVRVHLQRLAGNNAEYRAVVDRAYRRVLQRDAHDIELEYWARHETLPYILLLASIEDWARRNAPGLMYTTGAASVSIHSGHLTTVRLSPAVALEARLVVGIERTGTGAALATELGRNVVAPGAGEIASVGGIHFIAVGREPRVAP